MTSLLLGGGGEVVQPALTHVKSFKGGLGSDLVSPRAQLQSVLRVACTNDSDD